MDYINLSMYTNMNQSELAHRLFDLLMICNQASCDDVNDLPERFCDQYSIYGDISNALRKIEIVDYEASIEACALVLK